MEGPTLEWRNIRYTVGKQAAAAGGAVTAPAGEDATPVSKKKGAFRVILDDVSGSAEPGKLLAIMGPSGSGKTSLLNALAHRLPKEKYATLGGRVLLNGADVHGADEPIDMPAVSAYVTQDDALFALSTVRETLLFAAQLRLPKTSARAREERVDAVIRELGLIKVRGTVVGSDKIRGVSGGERKRVNIGIELLHDPKLVFLDEPTSGLDAFQALSVMETLKALSARGRTVIASIHQPRSSIYAMLDSLVLLSSGRAMYTGPAGANCASFFADAGVPVPPDFNPADHYLDVISLDLRSPEAAARTGKVVNRLRERFAAHSVARAAEAEANKVELGLGADAKKAQIEGLAQHAQPSFWTAFLLLLERSWREQTRDKTTLGIKYMMNSFFCAMFGLVYYNMPRDQTSIQNRTGILFFLAMNQAFGASISISQIIPLQLKVVSRERAARLYGAIPYYMATFVTCLPLELVPQFIYSVIIYFLAGLRPGWEHLLVYMGILMLENFVAIGLGMALSGSFKDVAMAPQIAPAIEYKEFHRMIAVLASDESHELCKWAKSINNFAYKEKESLVWMTRVVAEQMTKAKPDQEEPLLIVPYGACGSGKTGSTRLVLEKHGLTKEDCIEVNVDDLVRSYMAEVSHNEHMFGDDDTYFAVRKGWPSRACAECIKEAIRTRRHIIKETTGKKTTSARKVVAPAAEAGYTTLIVYACTPFAKIVPRVLGRKVATGQGHPPFARLAEMCRKSARNLEVFRKAGGDKAQVIFANNAGPKEVGPHLVEDKEELHVMSAHEPWQFENRVMLQCEAAGNKYTIDGIKAALDEHLVNSFSKSKSEIHRSRRRTRTGSKSDLRRAKMPILPPPGMGGDAGRGIGAPPPMPGVLPLKAGITSIAYIDREQQRQLQKHASELQPSTGKDLLATALGGHNNATAATVVVGERRRSTRQ